MRILFALLICTSALADEDSAEKAQARVLLGQGNALFERGDLKGALVDFRAAYALYPSPKLLVNAAAAERELGDLAGAANDLRHYLDDAGDDDATLAERARGDLKTLERRVGRIALAGWPARSTVEVDGKAARDPFYVKPAERHRVRVRAPTGEVDERDLDVSAGETVEIQMVARIVPPGQPPAHPPVVKKSRGWIAAVVLVSVVVVAGAVTAGVVLGTPQQTVPLKGDLGIYKFSDFH
jgi:hypothetical protein